MQIVTPDFVIILLRIHQNMPFEAKNLFFSGEGA